MTSASSFVMFPKSNLIVTPDFLHFVRITMLQPPFLGGYLFGVLLGGMDRNPY
jgi:hypothetical protein